MKNATVYGTSTNMSIPRQALYAATKKILCKFLHFLGMRQSDFNILAHDTNLRILLLFRTCYYSRVGIVVGGTLPRGKQLLSAFLRGTSSSRNGKNITAGERWKSRIELEHRNQALKGSFNNMPFILSWKPQMVVLWMWTEYR